MCEDHAAHEAAAPSRLSRRDLLTRAGTLAAGAAVLSRLDWIPPAAAASVEGSLSMAMHVHSSFSEGSGSMGSHLAHAQANGVDVVWWTDHDTRMDGAGLRETVHFTSLNDEAGDGRAAWIWQRTTSGSLAAGSTGGIVDAPASPLDTVPLGSLLVRAESAGSARASLGFYADSQPAKWNYRSRLPGQTLHLEVNPTSIGSDAYLEMLVTSSYHPAIAERRAGTYRMSYRFGGPGAPGNRVIDGLTGIVTVPVTPGTWNSVALRPADDFAALFPGLDVRDLSLFGIDLNAVSKGAIASGYFDYLRFSRQSSGQMPLQDQADLEIAYAASYPTVTQRQGLEVSKGQTHLNWFGGAISLPDYDYTGGYDDFLQQTIVPFIHDRDGLVSYNHPFGTGSGSPLDKPTQDELLRQTAGRIVANGALGADVLEVGYPLRGGVDLQHHVTLWDICSRNALFLTGNGVTDAHHGTDWARLSNDWTTSAWSANAAEASLLAALRAGRAWCGSLTRFHGALDLLVDRQCPMGSVSMSLLDRRRLTAIAIDLPVGSRLQVIQGLVDYAGASRPTAPTRVVKTYPATALTSGRVSLSVPTDVSSFIRTQVLDAAGAVVALSNPVWLLREQPPQGVPLPRAC